MRFFLTILSFLLTTFTCCQSLSDKYLHYKTNYYWHTTLYKSMQTHYYDLTDGNITQKDYPVLHYMYTRVISETPLVVKDTFERRDWSNYPYKYVQKGSSIYLQYSERGKRKPQLHKQYSLNRSDTVKWLTDKKSLDSEGRISLNGSSTYLGEERVEINGKQFQTFHFSENHEAWGIDGRPYVEEVFLEQASLLPIKFMTTYYDEKTGQKDLYSSTTILSSSSSSLPNYANKTTEDLVLYEDKSTVWTEQQKQVFLSMFAADRKQYADCLLKKLDGRIRFFHFEQSTYFKGLVVSKACE